jgi:hypothetical protein
MTVLLGRAAEVYDMIITGAVMEMSCCTTASHARLLLQYQQLCSVRETDCAVSTHAHHVSMMQDSCVSWSHTTRST